MSNNQNLKLVLGIAGWIFCTVGAILISLTIGITVMSNLQIYCGCESGECGWISYADMDLSGIKPSMPYWASFLTWIITMSIMILLILSGSKCLELRKTIASSGLLVHNLSKSLRTLIVYLMLIISFNLINDQNVSHFMNNHKSTDFIIDVIVWVVFIAVIFELTNVLDKAVQLKIENDLTI